MRAVAMVVVAAGCGGEPVGGVPNPGDDLDGGVLATFEVSGEQYRVWVTDAQAIEQIFELRDGTSMANIPNGALRVGSGPDDYNTPWTWHIDAQDIEMAEQTVEVCDGRPSLVEALLEDYLEVGRFCPWGATLVAVEDRR